MPDLQKIQQLVRSGPREALQPALRYTQEHPDDPNGWYLMASIHSALGQTDKVIDCCRKVTALDPKRFDALYNLGVALQHHGQFDAAADSYRRVIALKPDFASAHANLGLALWKLGQLEDAEVASREALRLDPDQVHALNNLGLIHRDRNRLDEAVAVFNEAVRRAPRMPEARYNLALCLRALGHPGEARPHLEEAVRLKPDYHEAHTELGRLAYTEKRLADAITHFERVCHLNPADAEGWTRLAEAYGSVGKHSEMLRTAERAVAINPGRAESHEILGRAQMVAGKGVIGPSRLAEESLRKAIRIKPDFAEAHLHLAACLRTQGRYPEALESYRRVRVLAPEDPAALAGMATMLEHLGQFDTAHQLLAPAIEEGVDDLAVVLPYAAISSRFGEKAHAMELLDRMVTDGNRDLHLRIEGHFMLGKLYDEDGLYDKAFQHYRTANDLYPERFDSEGKRWEFETLIGYFAEAKHRQRARATNRSRLPVFIVGMPRSGTTLTEQILASHPRVHGAGELVRLSESKHALATLTGKPWPQCVNHLNRKILDDVAQEHLDWLGRLAHGKARVTDKMPHNFILLGLIDLLFPEARIIHCQRDPMDNCLSIYFQQFNTDHAYANELASLGSYYRQYERVMAHWRQTLSVPILDVRYEQTVAEAEQSARRIVAFCGLDWDDRCLRFHESGRLVSTPSYDQVRQPIYTKSVARWKHYEKYLEPLRQSLYPPA